jgi:hypothetical protein
VADQSLTPEALASALLAKASVPPRLALTKVEAAQSLGVSVDFLEAHVLPDLAVIREGRKVLVPVTELERWCRERAARTLP